VVAGVNRVSMTVPVTIKYEKACRIDHVVFQSVAALFRGGHIVRYPDP
jgi:hypothetical protein